MVEEVGKIGQIQNATYEASTAISSIGETITEIDQIANSIAAAVEEQTAATGEIARNVTGLFCGQNKGGLTR